MSLKHLTCPSKTLGSSINASSMSFKLNNIKGWDDINLTAADFGSQAFAVIRNANNTILELIEFDPATIASSSITILKRGLKFTGDLTTEVTANKLPWTKGDTFIDIGVDTPQMYQWLQEYIDAAIVAGGVPSTTAVLGLVKMSLAPVSAASPIAVGDNDPRMPTQAEKDAMVGAGGTPSATNKFVTNDLVKTFIYTANDIWTKPTGISKVEVIVIGGGAGGGSGAQGTSGGGGSGGGGGGYKKETFLASQLGATETITIGTGGAGGAAVGSGSGNNGIAGGNTSFGSLLIAEGGAAGQGGTVPAGGAATTSRVSINEWDYIAATTSAQGAGGVGGAVSPSAGGVGISGNTDVPTGGGGGGGQSGASSAAGGVGGTITHTTIRTGGTAGALGGGAGGNGTSVPTGVPKGGAGGGGGGGKDFSANAGPGGNGGLYGGGGGGGGGSEVAVSGAGGNGAAGIMMVICS